MSQESNEEFEQWFDLHYPGQPLVYRGMCWMAWQAALDRVAPLVTQATIASMISRVHNGS